MVCGKFWNNWVGRGEYCKGGVALRWGRRFVDRGHDAVETHEDVCRGGEVVVADDEETTAWCRVAWCSRRWEDSGFFCGLFEE